MTRDEEELNAKSDMRIEKYARVLAPSQRAASAAAIPGIISDVHGLRRTAPVSARLVCPSDFPRDSASCPAAFAQQLEGHMVRHLCEVGDFVRRLRIEARFGELSRARLSLIRLQLSGEYAECNWIARPSDPWDASLPPLIGKRHASEQALYDAIKIRALLFRTLPDLQRAELRSYRYSAGESLDLIMSGTVSREAQMSVAIRSLPMKAKLFGFRFWMKEGVLQSLQRGEYVTSF